MAYWIDPVTLDPSTLIWEVYDSNHGLKIPISTYTDFSLQYVSPLWSNQWALLGELGKFVPVSSQRFISIEEVKEKEEGSTMSLHVAGMAGESVLIYALDLSGSVNNILSCSCIIGSTGDYVLQIPSQNCIITETHTQNPLSFIISSDNSSIESEAL